MSSEDKYKLASLCIGLGISGKACKELNAEHLRMIADNCFKDALNFRSFMISASEPVYTEDDIKVAFSDFYIDSHDDEIKFADLMRSLKGEPYQRGGK